jgi:hypothetical protein
LLSENVSPLLEKDALEIVAMWHEKVCFAGVTRLIIRCDGCVERRRYTYDATASEGWSSHPTDAFIQMRKDVRRR